MCEVIRNIVNPVGKNITEMYITEANLTISVSRV